MMDIGPDHVGVVLRDPNGTLREEISTALKRKEQVTLQSTPAKKAKEIEHPFPLCNGWNKNITNIVWAFKMSAANGNPVKFDPWLFCPWCAVDMKQTES